MTAKVTTTQTASEYDCGGYADIATTQDGDTGNDYSELPVKPYVSKDDDYSEPMEGQCDNNDGCHYLEQV